MAVEIGHWKCLSRRPDHEGLGVFRPRVMPAGKTTLDICHVAESTVSVHVHACRVVQKHCSDVVLFSLTRVSRISHSRAIGVKVGRTCGDGFFGSHVTGHHGSEQIVSGRTVMEEGKKQEIKRQFVN